MSCTCTMYKEDHSDALCPVNYETSLSHMGEASETWLLSAAEGLQLFAAQAAEQQQMWDEMHGLINTWPIMPYTQYPPGMPCATPQGHFVSPNTPIFNHQMDHPPATIRAPPNSFQSAAINHGPDMFPLQNSVLYPPPQIPHGLHKSTQTPSGLHLEKTSSYNFA